MYNNNTAFISRGEIDSSTLRAFFAAVRIIVCAVSVVGGGRPAAKFSLIVTACSRLGPRH